MSEKRNENRKDFPYYMQLTDATTSQLVGHLADISTGGFLLDSDKQIPVGQECNFNLALTEDVTDKPFITFLARSKWCRTDPTDPLVYNVGFHVLEMEPEDLEIFNIVVNLYGTNKPIDK
ncbi:MAG: PilZ domain-containing protein [Anaerolineales bacterium]|uniref:PilZ domain-containing protein n=1 Tax=Candidatus Desulfolinea nitratireducens TaxID=2841698 RepID=A0A8J6NJU6_9CHLR|nr:PilZ domain-containing protein [Candidatus Desulfolinea nitratireducens]MBL6959712.1 PilZ domain-containing protein [Anaerolineales bacterium]